MRNMHTQSPIKRLASLLFALLLVFGTVSTASASNSFYISGVIPAGSDGFAFVRITDLNDKLNGATLTVDGVPALSYVLEDDVLPATYWFVIDVSKVPFISDYNLSAIEYAAQMLTALPTGELDNVRIVWVADTVDVTSPMSMSDARTLINVDVALRYSAHNKTSSALYDGIATAIRGALGDSDRFHRIYLVTDGRNASTLNSLTTEINNTRPIPISAVLLTNTISSTASAHFTDGHKVLKDFVAANDGIVATMDMRKDVSVNVASLAEQANAALLVFQSHIENSFNVAVNLTSIYDTLDFRAKNQTIEVIGGSDSDSCTVNLNLAVVPSPTPGVAEPTVELDSTDPESKVTPAPSVDPDATEKPQYKTLTLGDKDEGTDTYIADMQRRLNQLDFMADSYIPGLYDEATANALKAFADQNKITLSSADGSSINENELRRLFDQDARAREEFTSAPTPTPTPKPQFIDLALNDKDTEGDTYITQMQSQLSELGFFTESYTPGVYDVATANALKAWCVRAGITIEEDGAKASVNTLQILSRSNVTPTPTPSPTPTPTPTPAPTEVPRFIDLEYGMVDDPNYPFIANMQMRLSELGYISASTIFSYGTYDDGTVEALNYFCNINNQPIENNGFKATIYLQQYLFSTIAQATPTPVPTASPTPTPTPEPSATPLPDFIALEIGDKDVGDAHYVLNMQTKLFELGYYTESYTPGEYDQATVNALRAFCQTAGLTDTSNGTKFDAQFLKLLSISTTKPTPTPSPTPTPTPVPQVIALKYEDKNMEGHTHVSDMQNRLMQLGYLTDASVELGTYDDATAAAMRAFCASNNVSPVNNGYDAPLTMLNILFSNAAIPYTPPTYVDLKLGEEDAKDVKYIAEMQKRLKDLNYFDGVYTVGKYDEATAAALLLFCQQGNYDTSANGEAVTAAFLETVLFSPNAKVRTVIEPSLGEKMSTALTGSIALFGLELPMWAIVAVCAVLLIIIVVLIIVVTHRGKSTHTTMMTNNTNTNTVMGMGMGMVTPASSIASKADTSIVHDDKTVAGSDDEMTVVDGGSPFSSGVSINLDMQYNGRTIINSRFNVNGELTIGRGKTANGIDCDVKTDPNDKSVSRHHCTLVEAGGRVKVRNVSSTARGTVLNGMSLSGSGASEEAMTVVDDSGYGSGEEYVNSGDVIQIGNHYITVNY